MRDVVAIYSRSTKQPSASAAADPPGNEGTWTGGCDAARKTGAYAFGQVRHAYGIDDAGTGAGGSVAILNAGEGVPRADRRVLARCFGLDAVRTRTLLTDGQAKPFGRGSFEPQEDLALVRGMAPGLRSVTFTQAWLAHAALVPRAGAGARAVAAARHVLDVLRRVRAPRARPPRRAARRARARG